MSFNEYSVRVFIDQLAEGQAAPAGGAVAAVSAAQAAALVVMVARMTNSRRDSGTTEVVAVVPPLAAECESIRSRSLDLGERDVVAFGAVMAAYGLAQDGAEAKIARSSAIQRALIDATEVQTGIAEAILRLLILVDQLLPCVNGSAIVDLAAAAEVARAAISIARLNVESNITQITDPGARATFIDRLSGVDQAVDRAAAISTSIRRGEQGRRGR